MKTLPTVATLRVPATTSNLGPGFDTLGIALKLYNTIRVERTKSNTIFVRNEQVTESAGDEARTPSEAVEAFSDATGLRVAGFEIVVSADVPLTRGLGSSATVRLGIIAGLNALLGKPLDTEEVLALVCSLEGHPDNATPALWGGCAVAGIIQGDVRYLRFRVPSQLKFVAAIPGFEVRTENARKVLPPAVPFKDAVSNVNHAALIAAAFAQGKYDLLSGLFEDKLHQPYRRALIPQLDDVIRAGVEAGAIGGWLSGGGPSVICLTKRNAKPVASAMKRAFQHRKHEAETQVLILEADNVGLRMKVE